MKMNALRFGKGFLVLIGNPRVQAAQMVISPGDSEGGPKNRHSRSDQWLLVMARAEISIVTGRRHRLKALSLFPIEHGERHEIRNTSRGPLKAANFYSPPGYTKAGNTLPLALL